MKRRMLLIATAGILVVPLVEGCGGGTPELSRAEYVAKLDALCRDFSARAKEIGEPRSYGDLADKEPRILDAFEKAIADKVGALHAPPEIAPQADRLVAIANRQREVLGGLAEAAKKGDLAKVQNLVGENDALNRQSGAIARSLGAKACS